MDQLINVAGKARYPSGRNKVEPRDNISHIHIQLQLV